MFNIGGFFSKIQGVYDKNVAIRSVAAQILKETAGIDALPEKISYESNILRIEGISHAAKSVIFMKKEKVLAALRVNEHFLRIRDIK